MEEQEYMAIEIENELDYHDSISKEWIEAISGQEMIKNNSRRQRRIEKVPSLLLRSENVKKRDYYEPFVVSLGPYHHGKMELEEGEKYKLTTLKRYIASTNKGEDYFSDKILEIIKLVRSCYLEGSTDDYDDKEFTRMMLLDGCFVLYFIECLTYRRKNSMLNFEHLGALGYASVTRDIFLLENQLPFIVLKVLMSLKFDDGGEAMLCTFFNYMNYGELVYKGENVIPKNHDRQALHLLEIYRVSFLPILAPDSGSSSGTISRLLRNAKWEEMKMNYDRHDKKMYSDRHDKKSRSLPSATELKSKGILLISPTHNESFTNIKFKSGLWYGQLELSPTRVFSSSSKAIILNLIAYEMCPRNPNDFRVATYMKLMKSLVVHSDDVKELRSKSILTHSLRGDEEVAKMFAEIETPAVNMFMFNNVFMINQLKRKIEKHCNSLTRTWLAELISLHFSSPWRTVALLGASSLLVLSFLQTYFTIYQHPDRSMEKNH